MGQQAARCGGNEVGMVEVKSTRNIRRQRRQDIYTLRGLPFAEGNSKPRQAGRSPHAVSTTERGSRQEARGLMRLSAAACTDGLGFTFLTDWDIRVRTGPWVFSEGNISLPQICPEKLPGTSGLETAMRLGTGSALWSRSVFLVSSSARKNEPGWPEVVRRDVRQDCSHRAHGGSLTWWGSGC